MSLCVRSLPMPPRLTSLFRPRSIGALLVVIVTATPTIARAQSAEESHWGLTASFTPTWTAHDKFRETLLNFEGTGTVEGSEFTIGVVRGRSLGGDWGVSFVHKPLKDGSGTVLTEESFSESRVAQNVLFKGVEAHWFIPFATIRDRVQIGLNVGGGAGFVEGNILQTQISAFSVPSGLPNFAEQVCSVYPPGTCRLTAAGLEITELRPAEDVMYSVTPLIKLELAGAVIVAPGLKVRVSGGLNMPSTSSFRVAVVYLIGAK
jgi:hypothetical protein